MIQIDRGIPITCLIHAPPFCRKCGCGGDWHFHGCIRGQQRGDTIWVRYERLWDEAQATLVRIA